MNWLDSWNLTGSISERPNKLLKTLENGPKMKQHVMTVCDALEMIQSKGWGATLEDAIVIQTALVLDVPVWTLNYRDFTAVKTLRFWTP